MNEFEQYYEMSEKTSWHTTDLDWNNIDTEKLSDFDKQLILATAVIEHGVPHYSATWDKVEELKDEWELKQFVTLWAGEEHRHSFALKKLADTLNIKGDARYYDQESTGDHYYHQVSESDFSGLHKESCITDCYSSIAGMLTYTTIQELVTAKYYYNGAKKTKSKFLKNLLNLIAKDEMKHHAFYGAAIKRYFQKSKDKKKYIEDVYNAVTHFSMPHSIYEQKFSFFDDVDNIGKLSLIEIKLRVGKLLTFDADLVKMLLQRPEYKSFAKMNKLVASA